MTAISDGIAGSYFCDRSYFSRFAVMFERTLIVVWLDPCRSAITEVLVYARRLKIRRCKCDEILV